MCPILDQILQRDRCADEGGNHVPHLPPHMILQQSSGPIRWMPTGSAHRAIIDRRVYVLDGGSVVELDGITPGRFLDPHLDHVAFSDPVIARLSANLPGLRPLADGGLWEGLVTSITGQAVSLHSAAAFQRRLCTMFSQPVHAHGREFLALPTADQVADASPERIKSIGLTGKRAQGLIAVAREVADGHVHEPTAESPESWMRDLCQLPMVGPWTAASALLWGVGHPDVYPKGDVALLKAARLAYDDSGMTMKELDALSEAWRPQRAIAARLLWTNLLGMGWDNE